MIVRDGQSGVIGPSTTCALGIRICILVIAFSRHGQLVVIVVRGIVVMAFPTSNILNQAFIRSTAILLANGTSLNDVFSHDVLMPFRTRIVAPSLRKSAFIKMSFTYD